MKFFQMLVFTAVMFSNIRWQWIQNGYAATLGAAIATYYATFILVKAIEVGWFGQRALRRLRTMEAHLVADSGQHSSDLAMSRRALHG